jgi:NAD(P)H-dependent FMN reductase
MTAKLIFLSGSIRKESLNAKLAEVATSMAKELGADATYIDLNDYQMPIYNGDLEDAEGLPENAIALKKLFIECDGFFIASPEYNSGYSALLKNTIDWLSRKHEADEKGLIAFSGKVAAISAASTGALGGLRGLVPLRILLGNIGVTVIPQQLAVSKANESFDDKGNLIDDKQKQTLQNVVQQFIKTTEALK